MGKNIFTPDCDLLNVIRKRFKLIGLPDQVLNTCYNDIEKWYNSNGPEECLVRLKFLKDCIKGYAANPEGFVIPTGPDHPWVAKRFKSRKLLKGSWGTLQKLASESPKKMREVAKVFQCTTAFSREVRLQDILDWKSSVESPYSGEDLTPFKDMLFNIADDVKYFIPDNLKRDIKYPTKDYDQVPEFKDHHEDAYIFQLNQVFNQDMTKQLWTMKNFDFFKPFIYSQFRDIQNYDSYRGLKQGSAELVCDPGMKFRFVLNHYKPLEYMAANLGDRLYNIVEVLPWDSTFHEQRGFSIIQNALKAGKTAYSLDMKSATDHFPFDLQLSLLKGLNFGPIWNHTVDLVSELYRLPADVKVKQPNTNEYFDIEPVVWTKGQPMGAYPSFAMFSLTHGALLLALCDGKYTGQFVVHGDDVVILDDDLAKKYQEVLASIGVEISTFKSVISNKFAEMNSQLIYTNQTVPMRKWRPVHNSNILDHVHYWGTGILDLVYPSKGKYKFKNDFKKSVLKDVLFGIPGILPNYQTLNPNGLSLDDRLAMIPDDFFIKEIPDAKFGIISKRTLQYRSKFSFKVEEPVTELKKQKLFTNSDDYLFFLERNNARIKAEQAEIQDFAGEQDICYHLANLCTELALSSFEQRQYILDTLGANISMKLSRLKKAAPELTKPRVNQLIARII